MTITGTHHKTSWTTIAVLVVFLFALGASLFYMPAAMGGEHTAGCPFMAHEEMLCGMGALEHLSVWQSAFTAIVPLFLIGVFALAAAATILHQLPPPRWATVFHRSVPTRARLRRLQPVPSRPWQELFASGLLHPKCF